MNNRFLLKQFHVKIFLRHPLFHVFSCMFFFNSSMGQADKLVNACVFSEDRFYEISQNDASRIISFTWTFEDCPLDVSGFRYIGFELENLSNQELVIDINYKENWKENPARFIVKPNSKIQPRIIINRVRSTLKEAWLRHFDGVRGLPFGFVGHWGAPDPSNIKRMSLRISAREGVFSGTSVRLKKPTGYEEFYFYNKSPKDISYPVVDVYGQSVMEDWEGKLFNKNTLKKRGKKHFKLYKNHSFRSEFSSFGGWKMGFTQIGTGFFYTKKINDKWWLIDPEGHLFWSIGVTGAGGASATSTLNRSILFPDLRSEQSSSHPLQDNLKPGMPGFKYDVEESKIFKPNSINFYNLNLRRKYGAQWEAKHEKVTSGRFKAWGINTYGAWSKINGETSLLNNSKISKNSNHPYTLIIHPKLQGLGSLKKMVDPFSLEFRTSLLSQLFKIKGYNRDPWLLGIFVNNEIHWNAPLDIPNQVLKLSNNTPARKAFEEFLQKKYNTIASLNAAWNSNFDGFDLINDESIGVYSRVFKEDLQDYFVFFVDTYYNTVHQKLKEIFPNHLYLGSRIHGRAKTNRLLHQVAAKYCDVISFNIYEFSVKDFSILSDIDKPALIGEFHFGTASHGVWGTGLRNASSLENQADLYQQYIYEAASHPNFVGAHWFQWSDQPVTGRFDGENFRIGIVNVTDQPYPSMVDAIKTSSAELYKTRLNLQ